MVQKWEYHHEEITWADFTKRMAELGEKGWEAYNHGIVPSLGFTVYFKRRIE